MIHNTYLRYAPQVLTPLERVKLWARVEALLASRLPPAPPGPGSPRAMASLAAATAAAAAATPSRQPRYAPAHAAAAAAPASGAVGQVAGTGAGAGAGGTTPAAAASSCGAGESGVFATPRGRRSTADAWPPVAEGAGAFIGIDEEEGGSTTLVDHTLSQVGGTMHTRLHGSLHTRCALHTRFIRWLLLAKLMTVRAGQLQ